VNTHKLILKDMIALDTGKGLTANSMGVSVTELETWIADSLIIAESQTVHDCPS